jgi:hypothetical protein
MVWLYRSLRVEGVGRSAPCDCILISWHMLCYAILFVYNVILDDKEFEKDIRYLFPVHLYGSIMMKTEGRNTLCYRKCLIYPFDVFNQGPGRSVGAEGNKEGRRRYRGLCRGGYFLL